MIDLQKDMASISRLSSGARLYLPHIILTSRLVCHVTPALIYQHLLVDNLF